MELKLSTTACSASVCLESRMLSIQVLELVETNRKFIKIFSFFFFFIQLSVQFIFFKNVLAILQVESLKKYRHVVEKCL